MKDYKLTINFLYWSANKAAKDFMGNSLHFAMIYYGDTYEINGRDKLDNTFLNCCCVRTLK